MKQKLRDIFNSLAIWHDSQNISKIFSCIGPQLHGISWIQKNTFPKRERKFVYLIKQISPDILFLKTRSRKRSAPSLKHRWLRKPLSCFSAAKQRYAARQDEARRLARQNLLGPLGIPFALTAWGERARQAYETQWLPAARHPDAGWDWPEIHRRNRNQPDALSLVIWIGEDRLCGLGFAVPSSSTVTLRFLEGDPRPDCPLIGRRALIALEASALYAQGIGRHQIRVEPANETFAALYRDRYGFALVSPKGAPAYYVRNIL